MRKRVRKIIFLILVASGVGGYSAFAAMQAPDAQETARKTQAQPSATAGEVDGDSIQMHFPVAKTVPETYDEIGQTAPVDLKTPENIKTEIEYDPETDCYVIHTRMDGVDVCTPFMMSAQEYSDYSLRQSMQQYYRERTAKHFAENKKSEFNFLDMQFSLGPLEKVFGPGGVQLKTQGSIELKMGMKHNNLGNPALPVSSRKKAYFDFDEKIQASVTAKVGDKMSFNMNYNTDATFDFDSKSLKLQYQGKEDEIVKNIEAGNVSMTTGSSLIRGSTALFGIKTTLQFGKLTATALVSQQQSESKTVSSKGGAQTTPFEVRVDAYDENRHYFLAHFFRDNYDQFASQLPYVSSGVSINRIEVWVTNKQGSYSESRNIVGFMDLAESSRIGNEHWMVTTSQPNPMNNANSLYNEIKTGYPDARNINWVTQALEPLAVYGIEGGQDYVKIESARKLSSSEFTLNEKLGYISLKSKLNADEMLAVAYEYTYNGQVYQVGEFSGDITDTDQSLYLKMLKGSTITTSLPIWDLMMKNVYSLGAYQVQKDKFRLYVQYQDDSTGVAVNTIPAGDIANKTLLQVMNLDRIDANENSYSDGIFDYIEGYTVLSSNGRIIFPVVEPFGSHLEKKIGNSTIAQKYVYKELYDSTLTVARQISEKNKFVMTGEYKASSGSEIRLNAMNVPKGSVVVTAGGMTLVENSDYIVDYAMGVVTILNQSIIEAGTPINVSLENQELFNMQRKTMLGLDLNYAFSKNFNIGATIMHLSEKALTEKVNMGDEVLNNTLWGANLSYNTQFQWLTNWLNKIPTVSATAPSTFSVNAEFAQLIPHQSKTGTTQGSSYIDDFESTQTGLDLKSPYSWTLASTPYDVDANALFPEARNSNDLSYGYNRSLLSWYYIDRMFTQKNSSLVPSHLKNDLNQLSNPYVREVSIREIFPNKEINYGESTTLQTLNLSFYPQERGPYNFDADNIDTEGNLLNPTKRWGGIMRKMDYTDFEASNIEYIQFWMMDPFLDEAQPNHKGGDLYFNLGEVSEDILKDGMKSFENGLPTDGDESQVSTTVWGKVSKRQSLTYAFDNSSGARGLQDVGLDGLTTDEEFSYHRTFLENLQTKLSPVTIETMRRDRFSPFNDPAGDNYHFYRGHDYDDEQLSILERYKRYNGVENNSRSSDEMDDDYYQSSKSVPDVEDINQDNTLNEYERYYQYRIYINPDSLAVGKNYITDKRETTVTLRNGQEGKAVWYQFKIPLSRPQKKVGSIQDFKTVRFIRMFMTDFEVPTHLRFATLELVRGEWRNYNYSLNLKGDAPAQGNLDVSVVNIEENAGQVPVNYVLPPGVTRIIDPGQSQITQLNEQAMSIKVTDLQPSDARAVYKNSSMDMRTYRRIQMFVHGERLIDDQTNLRNGDVSVFLRLGTDSKNNYYEYEIPLELTEPGNYSTYNSQDQEAVWPASNMFDFPLSLLTDLKLERNAKKRMDNSTVTYQTRYSIYDPDKTKNKVTIVGNPTLSDVRTMMIGVRNNSNMAKDVVVWVNEMRLTDFDQSGGWAAKANLNLGLSDIASLNVAGHVETVGFGGIDQSLTERRLDDYYQYNIATMVELGRFLPEKVGLKAPLFYSITEQRTSPKYNPLDEDILLKDALDNASGEAERDSINSLAIEKSTVESLSLSGVTFNVKSKTPMPYDPANFSVSYSYNRTSKESPTIEFENTYDHRGSFTYSYTPFVDPWKPGKGIKSKSKHLKFLKEWEFNYLPNNIAFNTNMSRYYYEQQMRDVTGMGSMALPTSVSKNFLWDRQFSLTWNFTKSLNLSLQTMTNAHIEEPAGVVNKKLFHDEYELWKDTVLNSIKHMGTPWNYSQTFNASYNAPFSKIPALDYLSFTAKYNATYTWDRGAQLAENINLGNTIANQGQMSLDGRFNLEQLYNKSKYLQSINKRFSSNNRSNAKAKKKKTKYERTILLREDTTVTVRHNLNRKKVKVVARNDSGKVVAVRTKVLDANNIIILDKGKQRLNLVITPSKKSDRSFWEEAAQYTLRGLMMVRNVSVRYRYTNTTSLPLFSPNAGDIFGQSTVHGPMAPGLDFAFGFTDEDYIYKAKERGWLLCDPTQISPAVIGVSKEFSFDATIEPIKGLKIALTGNLTDSRNSQIQFMFDDMTMTYGGSYTKTHIALKSAFRYASAKDGYASEAFNEFLRNREVIAARLEAQYQGMRYPNGGFLSSNRLANQPYNQANGGVNRSSADVMIPAFLAAYSGSNANKVSLSPFPGLASILPNWRITYDGFMQIPAIKKYFKAFTLNHAYQCTYSVGSYSSYLNWVAADGDFGFVRDELSGNPVPSSPFDISAVMITERFAPLIGLKVTLKNNITGNVEYKDSRTLTLNSAAGQIVEASTTDFTVGLGYKIANFNAILKIKNKQTGVSNDLTINADFSFRKNLALIRRIEQNFTQATSGTQTMAIKVTANYVLSKRITLGAYFDHQTNNPLVSSSAYPVSNSNYGISVRLSLMK